jgi:hypothetical protein
MSFPDAAKVLSGYGLKAEERQYSQIIPDDRAIKYFPIDSRVALEVVYAKDSGQITALALMTSPAYRPVKGLEVYLRVLDIEFHADGTYTAHLAKALPEKDAAHSKPK